MIAGAWYVMTYSMGRATPQTINSEDSSTKILIATQSSNYKNELTNLLVDYFNHKDVYLVVVDVDNLNRIEKVFDATIVVHTWEMWLPPNAVRDFKDNLRPNDKVLFLGTSGNGDLQIQGVDAISSASQISNVQNDFNEILAWLNSQSIEIN